MLKNTFYCGIITYHKEYTPDYLTQKKIKNYGEVELIQVKGRYEPIISEEDFEKVQLIMASKTAQMKNLNTGRRSTTGKKDLKISIFLLKMGVETLDFVIPLF